MKKTILALLLAGATFVTGCGDSNSFDGVSGQQGNPQPIVTPTPSTGYFVDVVNGNDATGSFNTGAPYATIQAAVAAAPTGATITVRPGTYNGGVTLKNGQRLLGVASDTRPILTGTVTLGDGNTIDFLSFQGTNGNAIDGDDQNGGTIVNSIFANTTNLGNGLQAFSVTGTWVVENNTMTNLAGIGVEITAEVGDHVVAQVNGNTITGNAFNAIGLLVSDNATMRAQVADNVMTGNQADFTFEVITGGPTADFVAQVVGNTNNDVYRFSRNDLTSRLRVERLGQLTTTLNSGGATILEIAEPTETAANGAAGFGLATP